MICQFPLGKSESLQSNVLSTPDPDKDSAGEKSLSLQPSARGIPHRKLRGQAPHSEFSLGLEHHPLHG